MTSTVFTSYIQLNQYDEAFVEKWIQSNLHLVLYVPKELFEEVSLKTKNTLVEVVELTQNEWFNDSISRLPLSRNEAKDDIPYIWSTHAKISCVHKTLLKKNHAFKFFAFIDFDTPRLLKDDTSWTYLLHTFTQPYLNISDKQLYIPGCWPKITETHDLTASICWRFCGTFFIGAAEPIAEFYNLYKTNFSRFIEENHLVLTWEVNFWAWLEVHAKWVPRWYQADHNDSMIRVPDAFGFTIIKPYATTVKYHYPNLSPYHPMSAAYVCHNGQEFLNTRFVNYWIYDSGSYYYPEDEHVIRTYNVCSLVTDTIEKYPAPRNFTLMENDCTNLIKENSGVFSEGIEDIRLYSSRETGQLCFIGSTLQYSYCDNIRMVRGNYDVETKKCTNMQLIEPPTKTWCEKNWAPIPVSADTDGFVYRWYPLEIGVVKKTDTTLGKLEIVVRKPMNELFRPIKGSTSFVPYEEDRLIGVVHFSEEKTPRQYFHRVIILDKNTFDVVKVSAIFCFVKPSVEFCIGFRIHGDRVGFWISQMDRDPLYLETKLELLWN